MGYTMTVGDAEDILIPENTVFRARVDKVVPRTIEWNDKQTNEKMSSPQMQFTFRILSDGPYKDMTVRGEVKAKFTVDSTSLLRNWCQSLLQRELPQGMSLDFDELLGLTADITVKHREAKDHSRIFVEIDDVMSPEGAFELQNQAPPF